MTKKGKLLKRIAWILLSGFIIMNIVAFFHAYKFTHYADNNIKKTATPGKLTTAEKLKTLLFGVNNPRPENRKKPKGQYETIVLQSNRKIECWYLKKQITERKDAVKGTVIICHGYGGDKSSMLDKAAFFDTLHYNSFLIDFMGSGGSEGNTTTIGYKEAEQVKTAYDYLQQQGEKNIYLFGSSMGSVAIMKAVSDYNLQPKCIIIECPFGSMYKTVCARFNNMHAPTFPMAGLLIFWGGIQNGYWAFSHNPVEYARKISNPVLLMYGNRDKSVSREETDEIYANLKGRKTLQVFELAGHENYLAGMYKQDWINAVTKFLDTR
ncbi:MAG: alpha/beta fold hydrolase [Ferruginibacter sp.]